MVSYLLSLPSDLIFIISKLLPRKDVVTFSLLSSAARQEVVDTLFHNVRLCEPWGDTQSALSCAGENVKRAINRIVIMPFPTIEPTPVPISIYHLLETLPNLSNLTFSYWAARLELRDLPLLNQLARKTQIRHLSFAVDDKAVASCPPVTGPVDLETASIRWFVGGDPQHQNRSLTHLYEFLLPSLTGNTSVDLEIDHRDPDAPSDAHLLDFRPFGPVCNSLRSFRYTTFSRSPKALEAVAEMFPNLSTLGIIFEGLDHGRWAVWTNEFLDPLSSFTGLTHLKIAIDLEISANDTLDEDHDFAWYRRCFLRRFAASKDVMNVCPRLLRCEWKQLGIDSEGNDQLHSFVIREEDGRRIVKPVMQWWMVKEYKREHGGPLPKDMVKENAYWDRFSG